MYEVVTTSAYDREIKKLNRKHKNDVVDEIEDAIDKLSRREITKQKSNHRLSNNQSKYTDLHVDGGRLILKYYYNFKENKLHIEDLVDHNELRRPRKKESLDDFTDQEVIDLLFLLD